MTLYLHPVAGDSELSGLEQMICAARAQWTTHPGDIVFWRVAAIGDGGHVAGYAETGRDAHAPDGQYWLRLYVAPELRSQGIGTMLYDDAVAFAWEQGATTLELALCAEDTQTVGFFERRGAALVPHAQHLRVLAAYLTLERDPLESGLPPTSLPAFEWVWSSPDLPEPRDGDLAELLFSAFHTPIPARETAETEQQVEYCDIC